MAIMSPLNRRAFLRRLGTASLGLMIADRIIADPYAPLRLLSPAFSPRTVRGRVLAGGRGLARVSITDGMTVVQTGNDGMFEYVGDGARPFVYLTIPAGYALPVGPNGTAAFYKLLSPGGADADVRWDLEAVDGSDDEHRFFVLADPQILDADDVARLHTETVPDILTTLKEEPVQHSFAVSCGDMMYNRLELFPEYEKAAKSLGIPCFQVLGNHDVEVLTKTDEESSATFMRYFGPTYYSFDRGEIHYVVLDDVFWFGDGYIGYLDRDQLDWLCADLSFVERGKTVVVFMHIPSFTTQHLREDKPKPERSVVVVNRELLYRILEPYRARIVAGHMHEIEHVVDGSVPIDVCGAVCGAWWTGDLCSDGTPNGYAIFDAKGSDIRRRYKSTGKPVGHQMRISPRGSDAAHPEEIVVNVWNWDASWNVVWYEDGIRKGAMTQRRGLDPLTVKLFEGKDRPKKHPWVEPGITEHLFYGSPSPMASVVIEATDGMGEVYRERI